VEFRTAALKDRIVAALSDQLESEVTIDTLEGRVFPRLALSGSGLVVRERGRTDVPPLFSVKRFEIRATLAGLMKKPRHVSELRLQGLEIHIPSVDADRNAGSQHFDAATSLPEAVIDRFEAPDTTLTILPKRSDKLPRVFAIHHLVMDSV